MTNDLINGSFELFGGVIWLLSVFKILKDKQIKGISWAPQAFFSSWGLWNIYYYPSLNQWYSFAGGLFLVSVNLWWTSLAIYYSYFNKENNG